MQRNKHNVIGSHGHNCDGHNCDGHTMVVSYEKHKDKLHLQAAQFPGHLLVRRINMLLQHWSSNIYLYNDIGLQF